MFEQFIKFVGLRQVAYSIRNSRCRADGVRKQSPGFLAADCVGGFRIHWHGYTPARPEEKKALAVLMNTVTSGVEDTILRFDFVTATAELIDNLVKESPMIPDGQSLNVLEHEELGLKLSDQPDEMVNETISRVVDGAFPDQAEALTGGTPE